MNLKYELTANWNFSLAAANDANIPGKTGVFTKKRNAEVPGTIHTDLLSHKLIDEPFYSDNETSLQWISECDWLYETKFTLPEDFNADRPVNLVFDGLDTVAEIYLNKAHIGTTDNMFRKYSFGINEYLKDGDNLLEITFRSPGRYAKEMEQKFGKLPVALNSERVYIRKAQYSFGWDWGPTFATCGIWRNVYLENINAPAIEYLYLKTNSISNSTAETEVNVELSADAGTGTDLLVSIADGENTVFQTRINTDGKKTFRLNAQINDPKLWAPNGIGQQKLYALEAKLVKADETLSTKNIKAGIRTIELQLQDGDKETFRFIVNGKPVFLKGANWIPAHSFLTVPAGDDYRYLLTKAAECNMNIMRVWGGGIYENDIFYEICDELGLLVWQDFMFACAAYPEHKEFIDNVTEEAIYNIKRIREHPSLAVWCGNNENEWIWYMEQKTSYNNMPGHNIYARTIPDLLKKLDPLTPYRISTPFGNGPDPNSMLSGNRHQWNIWSNFADYTEVVKDSSLFVTEFGFQGPANRETLNHYIPKGQRSIQSKDFEFHNKQIEGNERIIRFLAGHLPLRTGWEEFIYLAQLNQGLALKECLEHWRLKFPHTNGAVIWQLNDCWPVSSWSLIDSLNFPKLAYYFVQNAFAPTGVFFNKKEAGISITAVNDSMQKFSGSLKVVSLKNSKVKPLAVLSTDIALNEGETLGINFADNTNMKARDEIFVATLYDRDKNIVHRNLCNGERWKHIKFPKTSLKTKLIHKKHENVFHIKAEKTAFFVDLSGKELMFSQRGMIMLPGEKVSVRVETKHNNPPKLKEIKINTLNDFLK